MARFYAVRDSHEADFNKLQWKCFEAKQPVETLDIRLSIQPEHCIGVKSSSSTFAPRTLTSEDFGDFFKNCEHGR